jgi:hypothetical protein
MVGLAFTGKRKYWIQSYQQGSMRKWANNTGYRMSIPYKKYLKSDVSQNSDFGDVVDFGICA